MGRIEMKDMKERWLGVRLDSLNTNSEIKILVHRVNCGMLLGFSLVRDLGRQDMAHREVGLEQTCNKTLS